MPKQDPTKLKIDHQACTHVFTPVNSIRIVIPFHVQPHMFAAYEL